MLKKIMSCLAILVLTICLVGFALDQILPASRVHANRESPPQPASAGPINKETVPLTRSAQPVAFVMIGMVCILFGVMAVTPLLIDGSGAVIARRRSGPTIYPESEE